MALLLGLAAGRAEAMPMRLASDADIAGFAALVKAYSGASRVGWAVAAPTRAEADAVIANIGLHLAPAEQALLQRIKPQTAAEAGHVGEAERGPVGWIEPQLTRPTDSPACSWQVWLADPRVPTPGQSLANIPLAPNDRAPASAAATFRIAYAGLLQSKIYAFGETRPGAIRDLAIAPDVNIPVAAGETETILLAISRQPAPFLESIRAALASSGGRRVDLGKDHALSENLLGRGRGIGANIQLVGPNMVVAKGQSAKNTVVASADARAGELTESCTFVLTPAPEAMR
ncbi:MAG TPA: hypothetical protein VKV96_09505 [Roseiarcus sp.]|nr:hypothetical protein [Roseiarcus sp.]